MKLFLFRVEDEVKDDSNLVLVDNRPFSLYVLADSEEMAIEKIKRRYKKNDRLQPKILTTYKIASTLEEYVRDDLDDSYRPLLV